MGSSYACNRVRLVAVLMACLLFSAVFHSCGGSGGGGMAPGVSLTGGIEGYVYVPIGSGVRIASSSSIPAAHEALNEANVTVTCGSASINSMTNSYGYFSITNLPIGWCRLKIGKDGFTDFETDISIETNKTATITGLSLNPEDPHFCGNGVIEEGETCDAGMENTDRPSCTIDNDGTCEFCDTACVSFITAVRVSEEVFDIIDNKGQVDVIVGLREQFIIPTETQDKEETIEQMKEFSTESQSAVLSNLNFCNIRDIACSSRKDVDLKLDSQYWLINAFNGILTESGLQKLIKNSDIKNIAYDFPLQSY